MSDKRQADILGTLSAYAQVLGYLFAMQMLDEIRDSEMRASGAIDVPFCEHVPVAGEVL